MGGEDTVSADRVQNILGHDPGDADPVVGARSAADLVQNDQGSIRGVVQNRGSLCHLDPEGALARTQVISSANAGEDPIEDRKLRRFRRNETAYLRHHRDHRCLAQIGRFACHIRPGQDDESMVFIQMQVVGYEKILVLLNNRVTPLADRQLPLWRKGRPFEASFLSAKSE